METLAQRAALLRDSLDKSQQVTDAVVSTLGSFDSRLSALDSAMRPIQVRARLPHSSVTIVTYYTSTDLTASRQVRTHAVRTAHENIDRTLRSADVILTHFDRTREVPASNLLVHLLLGGSRASPTTKRGCSSPFGVQALNFNFYLYRQSVKFKRARTRICKAFWTRSIA
jgi:hypothetical protein